MYFIDLLVAITKGHHSTCIDLGWVAKQSLQVNQVHAWPGQTQSQVDPSFQLASTHASPFRQGLRVMFCYRGLP